MSDWISVHIVEKRIEADGVAGFRLKATNGTALPAYEAGAHIDVKLPNGLVRQYSLCGDGVATDTYELGILLDHGGRGGSRCAHEVLGQGDLLEVSAPRNLFALVPGRRAILFAGGIGITPIIAMAEQLARDGGDFVLHYCIRTEARAAFRGRLDAAAHADRVRYHFDDRPETALDAIAALAPPDPDTHLYVCGPDGFMTHILDTARQVGWPEHHLHFERFSAPDLTSDTDGAFELEVEGVGRIVPVAAGQSALEALAAAGIEIPVSCEQGICGTCLTTVVAGTPDHRDMYLSDDEHAANDCFTPCCSRALTPRLVIRI